jgi:Transglycosylase SLT domain
VSRTLLPLLIFCLLTGFARAAPDLRPPQSPGDQCRSAIATAERGHGIPPQLLAAIGRVESGRRDPGTGAWGPWPWTINSEGQGFWFESKAEAIQAVLALQARGVRSIDIGCMQVNLKHHPAAFPSLDMAFEPAVNADYAARFLLQLYGQTGDWTKATADYHSSNPSEGEPYAAKVTSIWPEEQRKAGLAPALPFTPAPGRQFLTAISPYSAHQPPRMLPLAGMAPGMLAMRMPQGTTATNGMASPRFMPPGMGQAGGIAAGAIQTAAAAVHPVAPGVAQAGTVSPGMGPGQNIMSPGRGLDFYRAAPIRVMMPIRLAAGMPNRSIVR